MRRNSFFHVSTHMRAVSIRAYVHEENVLCLQRRA